MSMTILMMLLIIHLAGGILGAVGAYKIYKQAPSVMTVHEELFTVVLSGAGILLAMYGLGASGFIIYFLFIK